MPSKELAPRCYSPSLRSGSMRHFAKWTFRLPVIALCLLVPQAWAPRASAAGEVGCVRGAVNCANNTASTMRSCSATVQCIGAPTWSIAAVTTDALNVTACLPAATTDASEATVTFTLIARAMVSAPTNRNCGWAFAAPMRGSLSGSLSISTADGLPVELMDFSIEDEAGPERDETQTPD